MTYDVLSDLHAYLPRLNRTRRFGCFILAHGTGSVISSRAYTPRPPLAGIDAKDILELFSACLAPCLLPSQAGDNEMQIRAQAGEGHLPSRRTFCQPLVYPSKTSLISNVAAVLLVCTVLQIANICFTNETSHITDCTSCAVYPCH